MAILQQRLKLLGAVFCLTHGAVAAANEVDPLSLQSAPEAPTKSERAPLRLYVEGSIGMAERRYGLPTARLTRGSVDLSWTAGDTSGLRFVVSNRLDNVHPSESGGPSTINSLREAYVGWQDQAAQHVVEFGRVNLRVGPAFGFNPTDFFRDGSSRVTTSVDPLANRDNRLGTFMLKLQRLGQAGSATILLAPKLESVRSARSFSLDLGATNHADRALVLFSGQTSTSVSGQALVYFERGKGFQLGANASSLLSDAAVGFVEVSGGRDTVVVPTSTGLASRVASGQRFASGLTYTTQSRLALTVEYEFNGFAANRSSWTKSAAAGQTSILESYLSQAQMRQDLAGRQAVFFHASHRGAIVKALEISGFVRLNLDDHSRLIWVEARYRWPTVDLALQFQRTSGTTLSEFGVLANRNVVQAVTAVYF